MLSITEVLVFGVVFILTYWIFKLNKKPARYPPGPYGIPVLGYMPFMDPVAPHKTVTKLAKTYGDVLSIKLGSRDVVYINGYDAAKEAFTNPHILGRPDFHTFKIAGGSFLTSDNDHWELQRRFTIRHLREFGFGKASLETVIAKEAEKLVKRFREKNGKPFQVSSTLNISVVNIIWHMTAGLHLDDEDPYYKMLMKFISDSQEAFGGAFLADFLTWGAAVFPHSITKLDKVQSLNDIMKTFIQKLIDEHEETLDVNNPRDLIDSFLIQMKKDKEDGVKDSYFTHEVLKANATGLFIAGSDTVANTVRDAILLLAQNPDVQQKLKREIGALKGEGQRVLLQDKRSLPYLEAFIMEVQRFCSIAPFGLPHFTTENTTIGEFQVPKNTLVIANQWAIHFEEKYWKDPMSFNPERFLNEDGTVNYKREGFMPFSLGKRLCLGDQLAKTELFLFLGYLIQDFTFCTPSGASPVSVSDATGGLVVRAPPFEVIATPT